eukprot:gnl/Spiro4/228_TR133_c0_g1_i1.p1 gnl/Spiro4/228_TR133_c0_g1~~gnl/Spiro4/228_TR133_c0_g1_i1.p1  ORF type:complete len:139 (+),score=29.45 gnl/Spiro4/228_TR133_c0_g1_i1:37-453(+)
MSWWWFLWILLIVELICLSVLIIPLPQRILKFLIQTIGRNSTMKKCVYVVGAVLAFVLYDLFSQQANLYHLKSQAVDLSEIEKHINPKLFRIQRNGYLIMFSLVMLPVLWKLGVLHLRAIAAETRLAELNQSVEVKDD